MAVDHRAMSESPEAHWFDDPELRVEGRAKVTGEARFSADINLPGALFAEFVSSPVAHARITSIDTAAAKQLPGVQAVLTGGDIGEHFYGRSLLDMPVLAIDRVRFIGERVAAVAADTREAALEAANLVRVEYDELPAMFDYEAATADGAPVLHPNRQSYTLIVGARSEVPHPNIQGYALRIQGADDLEAMFQACFRVVQDEYTYPRQHQGYLEPHACVVSVEPGGTVRVYSSNKNPFRFREQMALAVGLPADQIIVHSMHVGGDFGGKGHPMGELPAYYLSLATGKPVKAVMRYADEMVAGNPRHNTVCTLRTGVDREGRIVAHHWRAIYNGGAYIAPKPSVWPNPTTSALETYYIPNIKQEQIVIYTNTVPAGHVRAPGAAQMALAGEGHMDHVAREIGMDPIEFRLVNTLRPGQINPGGEHVREPRGVEMLEAVRREANWQDKITIPNRGRGVALRMRHVGQGKTNLEFSLLPDGRIEILYGTPDQGSGSQTLVRRIASRVLDVAPERLLIRYGDTSEAPPDAGAGASRVTHIVGQAARIGAAELKTRLEELATEVMGWPAGDVHLEADQFVVKGSEPREGASFEEVSRRILSGGELRITGSFDSEAPDGRPHVGEHAGDFNFCAYAIEVDVDPETGQVTPVDAVLVYDVGQIINPVGHQGQLDGSFVYGLGNALMEEMPFEDGKFVAANLNDYKLPTQMDTVPLRTVLLPTRVGPGPFGAKAVGEAVNAAVGPAMANAIFDAVGVQITTLPLTAERVYAALQRKAEPSTSGR